MDSKSSRTTSVLIAILSLLTFGALGLSVFMAGSSSPTPIAAAIEDKSPERVATKSKATSESRLAAAHLREARNAIRTGDHQRALIHMTRSYELSKDESLKTEITGLARRAPKLIWETKPTQISAKGQHAISQSGRYLASIEKGELRIFDQVLSRVIATHVLKTKPAKTRLRAPKDVTDLVWEAGDESLLVAYRGKTGIRRIKLLSPTKIEESKLEGDPVDLSDARFSANAKRLLTHQAGLHSAYEIGEGLKFLSKVEWKKLSKRGTKKRKRAAFSDTTPPEMMQISADGSTFAVKTKQEYRYSEIYAAKTDSMETPIFQGEVKQEERDFPGVGFGRHGPFKDDVREGSLSLSAKGRFLSIDGELFKTVLLDLQRGSTLDASLPGDGVTRWIDDKRAFLESDSSVSLLSIEGEKATLKPHALSAFSHRLVSLNTSKLGVTLLMRDQLYSQKSARGLAMHSLRASDLSPLLEGAYDARKRGVNVISPDGKTLIATTRAGIALIDTATGAIKALHPIGISSNIVFEADSTAIWVSDSKSIKRIEISGPRPKETLTFKASTQYLALSPDHKKLAFFNRHHYDFIRETKPDAKLKILDMASGRIDTIYGENESSRGQLVFDLDSKGLKSLHYTGVVSWWNIEDLSFLPSVGQIDHYSQLVEKNNALALGKHREGFPTLRLSVKTNTEVSKERSGKRLLLTPDGDRVLVWEGANFSLYSLKHWGRLTTFTAQCVDTQKGYSAPISVAFAPDGNSMICAFPNGMMRAYDFSGYARLLANPIQVTGKRDKDIFKDTKIANMMRDEKKDRDIRATLISEAAVFERPIYPAFGPKDGEFLFPSLDPYFRDADHFIGFARTHASSLRVDRWFQGKSAHFGHFAHSPNRQNFTMIVKRPYVKANVPSYPRLQPGPIHLLHFTKDGSSKTRVIEGSYSIAQPLNDGRIIALSSEGRLLEITGETHREISDKRFSDVNRLEVSDNGNIALVAANKKATLLDTRNGTTHYEDSYRYSLRTTTHILGPSDSILTINSGSVALQSLDHKTTLWSLGNRKAGWTSPMAFGPDQIILAGRGKNAGQTTFVDRKNGKRLRTIRNLAGDRAGIVDTDFTNKKLILRSTRHAWVYDLKRHFGAIDELEQYQDRPLAWAERHCGIKLNVFHVDAQEAADTLAWRAATLAEAFPRSPAWTSELFDPRKKSASPQRAKAQVAFTNRIAQDAEAFTRLIGDFRDADGKFNAEAYARSQDYQSLMNLKARQLDVLAENSLEYSSYQHSLIHAWRVQLRPKSQASSLAYLEALLLRLSVASPKGGQPRTLAQFHKEATRIKEGNTTFLARRYLLQARAELIGGSVLKAQEFYASARDATEEESTKREILREDLLVLLASGANESARKRLEEAQGISAQDMQSLRSWIDSQSQSFDELRASLNGSTFSIVIATIEKSVAETSGIQNGDLIERFNGMDLPSITLFNDLYRASTKSKHKPIFGGILQGKRGQNDFTLLLHSKSPNTAHGMILLRFTN